MKTLSSGKYRILLGCLLLIMTLVWTAFIFLQSANNGETSSAASNKIVVTITKVTKAVGINITDTGSLSHYIRKSAHFLEFGILGALIFLTVKVYKVKTFVFSIVPIGYSFVVASTDEYIQRFSPGRSCQISDVLIDVLGASFFILVLLAIIFISQKRKAKALSKNSVT